MESDKALELSRLFVKRHPLNAARILERQPLSDLREYMASGVPEDFSQSLRFMPPILACSILEGLPSSSAARILSRLPIENSLLILKQIKKEVSNKIQEQLPARFLKHLRTKMTYPDKTAGYIMNPELLTIPDEYTVAEASKLIREYRDYFYYYLFVVDREQKFKGHLITRQLLASNSEERVSDLVMPFPETLSPYTAYKDIVKFSGWQNKHALPVVSMDGLLLGAISYQNLKQIEHLLDQSSEGRSSDDIELWTQEVISVGLFGIVRSFFTTLVGKG